MSAVIDLLAELVGIDSVNPAYGGRGEADLARFLRERVDAVAGRRAAA